jgi:hypothetical protein
MLKQILPFWFFIFPLLVFCQIDTVGTIEDDFSEQLEDFYINTDETSDFDYVGHFDYLESYKDKPLSLNDATASDLESFGLLSPVQISNLLNYRQTVGDLLEIYELQAIPGFDLKTIRTILPFVSIKAQEGKKFNQKLKSWRKPRMEYLFRASTIVEDSRGFLEDNYEGDPYQLLFRFRAQVADAVRVGLTAEKDRGEAFFTGSNPQGFDFYSGHIALHKPANFIEDVILGDYNFAMGQGLIFLGGFAPGKGADVTGAKRRGRTLRPYTSANEVDYLRGGAIELSLPDHWTVAAFGSSRRIDGNLIEQDTFDSVEDEELFSSLLLSGFHRTNSELEDEKTIRQTTFGTTIKKAFSRLEIGGNFVYDQFDNSFSPRSEPYNLYRFSGSSLWNSSLDYSFHLNNFHFYGESAIDQNGSLANLHGLMTGLGKYTYLSLLYRDFSKEFQTLRGRPFSETRVTKNERGFYSGLTFRPTNRIHFSGYLDFWSHPWLRFNVDAPSRGREWLAKLSYKIRKGPEVYVQVREEIKEKNAPENVTAYDFLVPVTRRYYRLHLDYPISKALRWRSRAEWSFYDDTTVDGQEKGFLIYQDLIIKPMNSPWSVTTRLAYFATDGYNARIYAYENDVAYAFSIPSYFGTGTRFYANFRYKFRRGLTLEARYAQTFRTEEGIGSGNDFIDGNTRTDLRLQARWTFN